MNLDILMLFLKESKSNGYITAEGHTRFHNDLNKGVLKFKTNCSKDFYVSDNLILLVQFHLDGSVMHGYAISYLKERNLLNLPETIINLLLDDSLAKQKLALNLIKNLYINK